MKGNQQRPPVQHMTAKPPRLLDRDDFRDAVLKRDGACVICGRPAGQGWRLDAHHIMERRLFLHPDEAGGYFMANGATLCDNGSLESCHLQAEATLLTCEVIREKAGITDVLLPRNLYADQRYDKWGNAYLANGQRAKGPLFFDDSVAKILAAGGVLTDFTDRVKHPRTSHLPWSEGATEDDEFIPALRELAGAEVIATVKLDGEQTTCYTDYLHSRSVDGRHTDAQKLGAELPRQMGLANPRSLAGVWRKPIRDPHHSLPAAHLLLRSLDLERAQ
jgi:hypothetical protein